MLEKLLAKFGYVKTPIKIGITKPKKQMTKEAKRRLRQRALYRKNKLDILQREHAKQLPMFHTNQCPACNRDSPLTLQQYKLQTLAKLRERALNKRRQMKNENSIAIIEDRLNNMPSKDFLPDRPRHDVIQNPRRDEARGGYIL